MLCRAKQNFIQGFASRKICNIIETSGNLLIHEKYAIWAGIKTKNTSKFLLGRINITLEK